MESKAPTDRILDFITGQPPFYWRGSDVTLSLALTSNVQVLKKAPTGSAPASLSISVSC